MAAAAEAPEIIAGEPTESEPVDTWSEARISTITIEPAAVEEQISESSPHHFAAPNSDPIIEAASQTEFIKQPAVTADSEPLIPAFAETKNPPQDELQPAFEPVRNEPRFGAIVDPPRSASRRWAGIAALIVAAIGLVAVTSHSHSASSAARPNDAGLAVNQAPIQPAAFLRAVDSQGQLQIRWDRDSRAVREARDAVLHIQDGSAASDVPLDAPHLQGGAFNYARQSERIDVKLTIHEVSGQRAEAVTSFLGKLPETAKPQRVNDAAPKQSAELAKQSAELTRQNAALSSQSTQLGKQNSELAKQNAELSKATGELRKQNAELSNQESDLRKEREDLSKQMVKLKADLGTQTAHAKQLQQQVDDLIKQQQKKRLRAQSNFDPLE
jgi:hypothetical protein